MSQSLPDLLPVIRKLERSSALSEDDRSKLLALPGRHERVGPAQVLIRQGDPVGDCCFLVRGFAFRHKGTRCGKRQIISFHMDGDILDLQHLKLPQADHSVETLSDADLVWVGRSEIERLMKDAPNLADALWRDTLVDASIYREWILNLGRRNARSQIAHLLCELATRRSCADIGETDRFELPMTQEHIADATGMTVVHVNRTLRALTEEGAIERHSREVHVRDWARLETIADFDPAYLHLGSGA